MRLTETVGHFADLITGVSEPALHSRPTPDAWSASEILAHLRSCSDIWGSCMATILAEENPTIKAVNPGGWPLAADYAQQPFRESLEAFAKQRHELLPVLFRLTPEQWARGATITGAGKPLHRTVEFYARWLSRHEHSHWKSMLQTVNAVRTL